jgi:glycosyltransferase involved in cell wall biosynthesis
VSKKGVVISIESSFSAQVGILIPLYNPNRALLSKLLKSISEQSYSDWICVLYDDSQTLNEDVLKELGDERFRYVKNAKNLGIYSNYAQGISKLAEKVEYIFLSDQDDLWLPEKISKYLEKFQEGSIGLIVGNASVVDVDGAIIESNFLEAIGERPTFDKLLLNGNFYPGTLMALRPRHFPVSPILPNFNGLVFGFLPHDTWLILCATYLNSVAFVEEVLTLYVQHDRNTIGYNFPEITWANIRQARVDSDRVIELTGFPGWWYHYRNKIFSSYFIMSRLYYLRKENQVYSKRRFVREFVRTLSFEESRWDRHYFIRTIDKLSHRSERYHFFLWRWGSIRHFLFKKVVTFKKKIFPGVWIKAR